MKALLLKEPTAVSALLRPNLQGLAWDHLGYTQSQFWFAERRAGLLRLQHVLQDILPTFRSIPKSWMSRRVGRRLPYLLPDSGLTAQSSSLVFSLRLSHSHFYDLAEQF
jgi:hypothetical protein